MATGDTVVSVAVSSSPPPLLDHSPSNLSSPLSDVEDKATDADDMELEINSINPTQRGSVKAQENGREEDPSAAFDSDGESKLSDVDVNDSEAETERLYNTPPKNNGSRDVANGPGGSGHKQFTDRRDRAFERSPSKLQQQVPVDIDPDRVASDNDSLSEADEEDEDAASEASTDPSAEPAKRQTSRSPSPTKKGRENPVAEDVPDLQDTKQESAESRKRKRSSIGVQSEAEQPARKRTGSIAPPDGDQSTDEAAVVTDEANSTNPHTGDHSADDETVEKPEVKAKEDSRESVEDDPTESSRSKRSKQRNSKKRKSRSPGEAGKENQESHEPPDTDVVAADDAAPHDGEHGEADVDEEAEVAHRNEEEMERKRAAWDELAAIERQFNSFRERLYQERVEQLEREEAMLTGNSPNHPEYLAMLQCIDERREERIRVSNLQFMFKTDVLKKRAVAERAQILSQFHQSIRETREKVLEQLGEEWYAIQHQRRRHASAIPDFGIRLPPAKTQNIRNAVAYNKEVSILSGFAKHIGFPAAPAIQGASDDQVDGDFEAINRARQSTAQAAHPPPFHREPIITALPFNQNLGPAGEQFIEQTPWANPNHPSHQIQRQISQQHGSPVAQAFSGPSPNNRRHSQQPAGPFSSNALPVSNGNSPTQMHKSHSSAGHESVKAPKVGPGPALKQSIAQAS